MNWVRICKVDEVPVLGARRVSRATGMDVAIFRNDAGELFALLDRCPHKGGPLSQGIVFGRSVACPLHNWSISLNDGCAKEPDEGCTPSFQLKVEGDEVHLLQAELDSLGIDLPAPKAGPCIPIAVA